MYNIVYGDLLIGLDSGSSFNYAFSLGNMGMNQSAFAGTSSGGLYAINGTTSSRQYHTNGRRSAARNGAVFGNTVGSELGSFNSWSVSDGMISFSFNVAGLSVFENASSIALSWAESCYNDAVTMDLQVSRTITDVPEPTTVMIFGFGLIALALRKKFL